MSLPVAQVIVKKAKLLKAGTVFTLCHVGGRGFESRRLRHLFTMRVKNPHILIAQCVLVFCVTVLPVAVRAQDQSGPALGDTIDLSSWQSRSGKTLAEAIKGHSLAMVLLVDPRCGTCTAAKESFNTLKSQVEKPGIQYYVLMIPDGTDTQKYFSYADSLKLNAEAFVWSNTELKPPASLVTMALPSHLLLTNEGLLVNKWPGTQP